MSAKKHQYDLTQGGIVGRLLLVALPLMGTQLMQMAYNLTDIFWLGRVSSDVVAASGSAGMYLWLSNGVLLIGRMGAEIGVSQCLGRGERDRARGYSRNAMLVSLVLGIVFMAVVVLFNRPLIGFFNIQEAHVAADAQRYLIITGFAIPATYLSATVAGTFNACGNSRTPFFINAVGLAINMILDPALIFGLAMGIDGAAIGTSIAQLVVCALSLAAICWERTRPLGRYSFRVQPDRPMIGQIFRWSIPVALESLLFTLLAMIVSRFVAAFGAGAIAVQKVGSQVESLSWLIAGGFSSALTAFIGQNFGAGKWGRIREGVRLSTIFMGIWGIGVGLIILFFGGPLVGVFMPDQPELVRIGASYLAILAISEAFTTLEGVGAAGFRGAGRTLPPSVASIASNAFRVVLAWVLSRTSLGLDGIWWAISIGAVIRGAWIYLWYLYMLRDMPKTDVQQEQAT